MLPLLLEEDNKLPYDDPPQTGPTLWTGKTTDPEQQHDARHQDLP